MTVLRLLVATILALALADCGGMHACTANGVPCAEVAPRAQARDPSPGGGPSAMVFQVDTAAASAPFVPPVVEDPAPAPAPAATPTATAVEPTAAPEPEDSGRHHGRHRHRARSGRHHRGGHERSSGHHRSGSHSRRHHRD